MVVNKQAKAEQDLIDIWLYTFSKWDESQADKYLDELETGLNVLAENPMIGIDCDFIRKGYRLYAINHHLIFYKIRSDSIEITRVLHESMDVQQHL